MESITFFVPGKPRGKGRPRFSGGHAYTDEQTKAYEHQIAANYRKAAKGVCFAEDVFVSVQIQQQMPVPKSATKAKRADMLSGRTYPRTKPDIDNVIKAVLDGLNGVAYKDDACVVVLHSRKVYSDNPGVLVKITRMEGGNGLGGQEAVHLL